MKKNILIFTILFSIAFVLSRTTYYGKIIISQSLIDLNGVPWLYSTVGIIFGIIAAFIIEKQWDRWDNLVEASRDEINTLYEMWNWAFDFHGNKEKRELRILVTQYLKAVNEEWDKTEGGEASLELDMILDKMRENISGMMEDGVKQSQVFQALFSHLDNTREMRLHYSSSHIPVMVRGTFILTTVIIIVESFFVGVNNVWLAYIFIYSISILAYAIYLVVDDLDHPFRPGAWHLTPNNYKKLFDQLEKEI